MSENNSILKDDLNFEFDEMVDNDFSLLDRNMKKEYLIENTRNPIFIGYLEKKGIELGEVINCGNGIIFRCKKPENTILKVTSSRVAGFSTKDIVDIDTAEKSQAAHMNIGYSYEGYAYDMVPNERKKELGLVPYFRIKIYNINSENERGEVVDYLNCYHLPLYETLNEHFEEKKREGLTQVEREKTTLKIVRDILQCLSNAERKIHRDIKPENIMYDPSQEKFLLIDWGTASENLKNSVDPMKDLLRLPRFFSNYFTDPRRLQGKADDDIEFDFSIDLYSLGVLMIYLAHPNGWFAGVNCDNFFYQTFDSTLVTRSRVKEIVVISADVVGNLTKEMSNDFKILIDNAIFHKYNDVSEMKNDVKKLLAEDKTIKKIKSVSPLCGIGIALVLFFVTLIFSGFEGMKTSMFTDGTPLVAFKLLAICALFPLALSIANIIFQYIMNQKPSKKKKSVGWKLRIKGGEGIGILLVYILMFFTTKSLLQELIMNITLDVSCFLFLVASVIPLTMSRISAKGKLLGLRMLVCGILTGLGVGICVACCIASGDYSNVLSKEFMELISMLVILGGGIGFAAYLSTLLFYPTTVSSKEDITI